MRIAILLLLATSAFAQSRPLISATFGTPCTYNQSGNSILGDRFFTVQNSSGTIYANTNDTDGWNNALLGSGGRNMMFSTLAGTTCPTTGTLVNSMDAWGQESQTGTDGATFKSTDIFSITLSGTDTLFMWSTRDVYNSSTPPYIETSANPQLLKSTDGGSTWTPSPPSTAQPYVSPTFTGTHFPTPAFLHYGKDYSGAGPDGSSTYVYMYSNDGSWNNGNYLTLARIAVANLAACVSDTSCASDYVQWYQGGVCSSSGSWSSAYATAAHVISGTYQISMTSATYIPAYQRYLLMGWYFPSIPSSLNAGSTTWKLYEGPTPCGPFDNFQNTSWTTGDYAGMYDEQVMDATVAADGAIHTTLTSTADFLVSSGYTLWMTSMTLTPGNPGTQATAGSQFTAGVSLQ